MATAFSPCDVLENRYEYFQAETRLTRPAAETKNLRSLRNAISVFFVEWTLLV
jgi:hypothetical protein